MHFKGKQQHLSGLLSVQAELLQQEIINRVRLATAVQQLLPDLPKQAAAAEERMLMAEYVKGYQLVSATMSASSCHDMLVFACYAIED